MEEEILIYVAGNPDAYPVEYYDTGKEEYAGLIPELLEEFSVESAYEIRYYAPGEEDQREDLSRNRQVDLISGCDGSEELSHVEGEEIPVLLAELEGEETSYCLYVSETAPDGFDQDLREFLSETSQAEKTGILIQAAAGDARVVHRGALWAVGGLVCTVVVLLVAIAVLIRRQKKRLEDMRREREVDEVTGIGNTEHLFRYYQTYVQDRNRILYRMFYFYFDAERMEKTGGHKELVEFSRCTALVLQEYLSDGDILARVSDGGFALLRLSAGEDKEWFLPAIQKIRGMMGREGMVCAGDMSVGIYQLKAGDRDMNEILFNASQSAQSAYREGVEYRYCTEELISNAQEERQLQADVGRGLEDGEFRLCIQYYVDSEKGRIVGGEALSRWEHPEKGQLSPACFVPLMEKEGLTSRLDYYCLDKVCAFLEDLRRAGREDFFVSCNFSRETFSEGDFVKKCEDIIGKYQFERELLIFEITESAMMRNFEVAEKNIRKMKKMGIRIVLDDFGEGFTSFFDIQEYQLDGLKLGKGLIDRLGTRAGDIIIRAMIWVGHELGLTVLAEGVENEDQVRILQGMHCDVIQGFYYYQPLPDWEAKRLIMRSGGICL